MTKPPAFTLNIITGLQLVVRSSYEDQPATINVMLDKKVFIARDIDKDTKVVTVVPIAPRTGTSSKGAYKMYAYQVQVLQRATLAHMLVAISVYGNKSPPTVVFGELKVAASHRTKAISGHAGPSVVFVDVLILEEGMTEQRLTDLIEHFILICEQ